ncbi:MAG: methylenetetrahydrofolate reductase [NAD(P)H] [Pseudomonadota bacterium]|nr:methylenetetrahydrofolate reductase [NAD(P)H] [Pseudomonadota bacterium]
MNQTEHNARTFSFEFFPPKSELGLEKLLDTARQLSDLGPEFFSVTFGAGGSTRDRTFETAIQVGKTTNVPVAPHISCISASASGIREMLDRYRNHGINRLVALRGDMPSGTVDPGEFHYASELIAFIRQETGSDFHLEVACYPEYHPQAPSPLADLDNFQRKVEAGADSAITQYFYNGDAYLRFVDECQRRGIDLPIVPGIMPIMNFTQLARFSDACGAEIPRWIRKRLESYGDDLDAIRSFGSEVVTRLCERLLEEGAPGLHFYTLNQAGPTLEIWQNLRLS